METSAWSWLGLLLYIMLMAVFFFAAFGTSNMSEDSIDEYMDKLIRESGSR